MLALRFGDIRTSHFVKERKSICTRDTDFGGDGGMVSSRGGVSSATD
jgi:hypothetical protein